MLKPGELETVLNNISAERPPLESISPEAWHIMSSVLHKNLKDAGDKEDVYDISIDALNRFGADFSFVAIFRDDRKYSTAVRIRVDSELVNKVEDYARKMLPDVTVMRYRIPIFEDGRLFKRFLIDSKLPLVSDAIVLPDGVQAVRADMDEIYNNLITLDSPLKLLLPAFKRMVPYKSALSTHIFVDGSAVGNIGMAGRKILPAEMLGILTIIAKLIGNRLQDIGFGKSYGS